MNWEGNTEIPVVATTDKSPALAAFNSQLWMVYKGYGNENIYWATYDGNTWTTPVPILVGSNTSPVPTNASPTPTVFNNQLWIGYKGGVGGDSANNLYSVNGSVPG